MAMWAILFALVVSYFGLLGDQTPRFARIEAYSHLRLQWDEHKIPVELLRAWGAVQLDTSRFDLGAGIVEYHVGETEWDAFLNDTEQGMAALTRELYTFPIILGDTCIGSIAARPTNGRYLVVGPRFGDCPACTIHALEHADSMLATRIYLVSSLAFEDAIIELNDGEVYVIRRDQEWLSIQTAVTEWRQATQEWKDRLRVFED